MQMTLPWVKQGLLAHPPDFRNDINGLRGWAVAAVVLYHFGVPGFGGGFVGVDIFFVISGFLMTGITIRGLERGGFSITDFYLARAKRIVPALAVLCAALLAFGWLVLMPSDYKTLASHSVYSLGFLSNIEFWKEAGYFDAASHEKWLLHTWSLSAEWQFYLILPILSLFVWRLIPGRKPQFLMLAGAAALSSGACILMSDGNQTFAFYLLPTRAWEMLAGGLVYLMAWPGWLPATRRKWVEAAGFILIALSIALFDKSTSWPGWRAIFPVVATMAVLASERQSIWAGNRIAQWLGQRSYSLYLWHWPIFVFLCYVEHASEPGPLFAGLLGTLILGHISYAWVEDRSRYALGKTSRGNAVAALVALVSCVVVSGFGVWLKHGIPGRVSKEAELIANEADNINPRRGECNSKDAGMSPSCTYGGSATKVFVIGDSHGDAVVTGVAAAMPDPGAGVTQWTHNGCAFVPGLKMTPAVIAANADNAHCSDFIGWVEKQLDGTPPGSPIVIINRYAAAAFGLNEDVPAANTPRVYFTQVQTTATPAFLAEFSKRITDSACSMAKTRPVYLVRPIPEMGVNVPKVLSRRRAMGIQEDISLPIGEYRKRNAWVWAAQDAARDRCGVRILDPLPYLCHDARCFGSRNGRPLYSDDDHLSESGNKLLAPMFAEVYKNL